jgi:hypothetical protein
MRSECLPFHGDEGPAQLRQRLSRFRSTEARGFSISSVGPVTGSAADHLWLAAPLGHLLIVPKPHPLQAKGVEEVAR